MENKGLSFSEAIDRATLGYVSGGIGTFSEKILHRTLKFYFESDEVNHEVEYQGVVVDILGNSGIVEIQTRSFNKLAQKLEKFLPENNVTVVYPIIENKKICRVDTLTGESYPPRKSRKKGRATDALLELGRIRKFIPDENLTVVIVFVDAIETRMLEGKVKVGRKRTEKLDCIPTSLNSMLILRERRDYFALLPEGLPPEFSSADFERISRIKGIDAHGALMLLLQIGILSREKVGRAYLYTVNNL